MSRFVLTAQLQLQAPSNVGQVVKQIQGQLKNVNVKIEAQGAAKSTRQVQQLTKAVKQADSAAFKLGKTFTSSLKRFAAFSIATRFVSLFTQGLGGAVDEAIKFERELIKVAQVTGRTIKQLGELTGEIKRLSTSLGVSSSELLGVSRALSQAGFSATETKIALDALAKSSLAPTFEDMAKTAEGAIAIFNQFGKGAVALEAQLGAINAVAGKFAVEAGDLISVIRRTGGVFKAAGGDLNELIALFTSVRSTTRESAESIATGLRTIFTRIQRPTTIKFLEKLGVKLTDLEGRFVGPFEAIKRLSQALGDMKPGDLGFIQIAEQLGGFRQIGKVIPLLQQFAISQEAYNVALGGANSLSKDAETAQQSLAVQLAKLREEWMATVRSITDSTGFKIAIEAALGLASAVLKIADALKGLLPLLMAFGAFKLAKGMGGFLAGAKAGGMGAVPKFATGGTVPGTGSRDTVPAMLTPGEFVIRKSSAQKIGKKNLQSMNTKGYAKGGFAIQMQKDAVGGFYLSPSKGEDASESAAIGYGKKDSLPKDLVSKKAIQNLRKINPNLPNPFTTAAVGDLKGLAGLKAQDQGKALSGLGDVYKPAKGQGTWTLGTGSLVDSKGNITKSAMTNLVGRDNTFKNKQELKARIQSDLKAANFQPEAAAKVPLKAKGDVAGMILGDGGDSTSSSEIDTAVREAAGKHLKSAINDLLDKEGPIRDLLTSKKLKTINLDMTGTKKDIKNNLLDPTKGAVRSIAGFVQEGLVSAITGAKVAGGGTAFDFPDLQNKSGSIQERLSLLYGDITAKQSADAKPKANAENARKILKKFTDSVASDPDKYATKSYIKDITPFAKGGPAPSDTVPAMLTPGEFVVNKKAAQSIGHASLDRMNKKGVAGFAKGGSVGGVKSFALGGGAGGGMGNAAVFTAISVILPTVQAGLEGLFGASEELRMAFDAGKKGFTAGIAMFVLLSAPMFLLNRKTASANKELEKLGNVSGGAGKKLKELADVQLEGSPEKVDAQSISIMGDSLSVSGELQIHAQSVLLSGDIKQGAETAGADGAGTDLDPTVTRGQTPEAVRELKIQERQQGLSTQVESRADVGVVPRGEFKPGSDPAANRAALQGQLTNAKAAEVQTRSAASRSRTNLEGNLDTGGNTVGLNTKLAEQQKLRSTAQGQLTKQANKPAGTENLEAIKKYEKQLKDADSAISDITAKQEEHNLTIEAAARAQEEYSGIIEKTNESLADLDASDLKEKNKTADTLAAARSQDGRADGSLVGFSEKQKKRVKPLIARKEMLIAENKAAGPVDLSKETGLNRAKGRATMKRDQLQGRSDALKASGQKGSPAWIKVQKELKANAKKLKTINKEYKKTVKANQVTSKLHRKNNAEIKRLSKSIAGGRKTMELRFMDAAKAIGKGGAKLRGYMKTAGKKMAKAAGKFMGKGRSVKDMGKGLAGMLPGLGAMAAGAFEAVTSFQEATFQKGIASGTPEDLAIASGMIDQNVETKMQQSRLNDTLMGAASGAALGAFLGPIGMAVGGVIGGAAGFFKDEIFSAIGIGPTREEKAEKMRAGMRTEVAQSNLENNIGPQIQKSMEKFSKGGGEQDFQDVLKNIDLAEKEASVIAKTDKKAAQEVRKKNDEVAKNMAVTAGGGAADEAELNRRIAELTAKFPLLKEELENTAKSAFMVAQANRAQIKLQADVLATSSIFAAAGLEVTNFIDGLQTGANSWNSTVRTLQEAQKNIALGKGAGDAVSDARKRVNDRLASSGVDMGGEGAAAINRQFDLLDNAAEFSSNLPSVLKNVRVDKGATNVKTKADITDQLLQAAGADADSEMGKVIAGRVEQLTGDQMTALKQGSLQLSDVFSDLQGQISQLGSGALAAAQAMQAHENTMLKLTAIRIKAEQNLISMQRKAVDLQLEAAQIAAKFGGASVTAEQRRNVAIEKFNLVAGRLGAGALTTGSGGDIRNSSAALAGQFAAQQMASRRTGAFGGTAGLEADKRKELQAAQAELVGVTKALIEADKQELDILKKKNALEKSSLDALISGDVDKFEKEQRAAQATQVLAAGDMVGLGGFGADTLALARENITKQKAAGVSDIGGVDIRTVEARATQAALASRGIVDPRAAALAAGQTQQEQEIEGRIRDRAGALGAIGENLVDMAQMEVQTATINIQTADLKFREGLANAALNFARGGMVYASTGMFVPRGTDTVPAMLTPGEFVVNRAAVNRGNNLQMLRAINSGNQSSEAAPASAMSQGGQVSYYNRGSRNPVAAGGADASMLEGLNAFNSAFAKNIANLQNTKFQIKLDTTSVNVNLNGGSFLNSLKDEVKSELLAEIGSQISSLKFTDSGDPKVNNSVLG